DGTSGCSTPIAFTIESITCEGCVLRAGDRDAVDYTLAFAPDGTIYDQGAYMFGLPTRTGPITITAVLRDRTGQTETVTTTAAGDRLIGLDAECWILPPSTDPSWKPCGATRSASDAIYALPVGQTIDHGTFRVLAADDDWFNPGSDLPAGGHR